MSERHLRSRPFLVYCSVPRGTLPWAGVMSDDCALVCKNTLDSNSVIEPGKCVKRGIFEAVCLRILKLKKPSSTSILAWISGFASNLF